MINPLIVIIILVIYMIILFFVGIFIEKKHKNGKNYANNPFIYTLGLAVYCSTWTFYGSVELAATNKDLFLPVYTGATLSIIFWWFIVRKLVLIKQKYKTTNIADFLSARYSKSSMVAIITTIVSIIGLVPYIGLQLKAMLSSFDIISGYKLFFENQSNLIGLFLILFVIFFIIIFGMRKIDSSESNPGMTYIVAIQSIIKILAFLSVGIFVTFFVFNGIGDIFTQSAQNVNTLNLNNTHVDFFTWLTYLLLSMSAIIFLPRMFHMSVTEKYK
jgi:Na+/proline symporter